MTIQKRFVWFFVLYLLAVTIIIAGLSISFLHGSFTLFAKAKNPAIVSVMSERIFEKTLVTFGFFIILVIGITIPVGILLAKLISRSYMNIFKSLTQIAEKRLFLDKTASIGNNERIILQHYIDLLIEDQEKLREYENIKSWNNGAKMLMHELKNPLTPLKLSVQNLELIKSKDPVISDDLQSINTALFDIQNILFKFKELVNIEFGKKEKFDLLAFLTEIFNQLQQKFGKISSERNISSNTIIVFSERILLKMLFNNLINNGMESNPEGFYLVIEEEAECIRIEFVTKNRKIKNPSQIFRFGYSDKGKKRGFGLFLCQQISNYLDLDLQFNSKNNDVIFFITIKKEKNRR